MALLFEVSHFLWHGQRWRRGEASSGSEKQIEVLKTALSAIASTDVESVTSGREFVPVPWLRRLQTASIPLLIRLCANRRLRLDEEGLGL
ncbi:hypothetical protein CRI94_02000 [Longibacter salinarum]|uniref:Uncharacterized protein n=1 Tax=Longibacter salinarum TaxID=1850348 RepID=A0A2A8D2I1_9BACT|nr:hypothetical protein CRI94_02000 [Longibacter salinarum]